MMPFIFEFINYFDAFDFSIAKHISTAFFTLTTPPVTDKLAKSTKSSVPGFMCFFPLNETEDFNITSLISAIVIVGKYDFNIAATPATIGAAIDVPCNFI